MPSRTSIFDDPAAQHVQERRDRAESERAAAYEARGIDHGTDRTGRVFPVASERNRRVFGDLELPDAGSEFTIDRDRRRELDERISAMPTRDMEAVKRAEARLGELRSHNRTLSGFDGRVSGRMKQIEEDFGIRRRPGADEPQGDLGRKVDQLKEQKGKTINPVRAFFTRRDSSEPTAKAIEAAKKLEEKEKSPEIKEYRLALEEYKRWEDRREEVAEKMARNEREILKLEDEIHFEPEPLPAPERREPEAEEAAPEPIKGHFDAGERHSPTPEGYVRYAEDLGGGREFVHDIPRAEAEETIAGYERQRREEDAELRRRRGEPEPEPEPVAEAEVSGEVRPEHEEETEPQPRPTPSEPRPGRRQLTENVEVDEAGRKYLTPFEGMFEEGSQDRKQFSAQREEAIKRRREAGDENPERFHTQYVMAPEGERDEDSFVGIHQDGRDVARFTAEGEMVFEDDVDPLTVLQKMAEDGLVDQAEIEKLLAFNTHPQEELRRFQRAVSDGEMSREEAERRLIDAGFRRRPRPAGGTGVVTGFGTPGSVRYEPREMQRSLSQEFVIDREQSAYEHIRNKTIQAYHNTAAGFLGMRAFMEGRKDYAKSLESERDRLQERLDAGEITWDQAAEKMEELGFNRTQQRRRDPGMGTSLSPTLTNRIAPKTGNLSRDFETPNIVGLALDRKDAELPEAEIGKRQQDLLDRQRRRMEKAQEYATEIQKIEDVQGLGDAAKFAVGTAIEVSASMAKYLGAGLAGGAAGLKAGGPAGAVAGGMSAPALLGWLEYGGQIYSTALEEGAEPTEAFGSGVRYGLPAGAVSIVVPGAWGQLILRSFGREHVKRVLQRQMRESGIARMSEEEFRRAAARHQIFSAARTMGVSTPAEGLAEATAESLVIAAERSVIPDRKSTPEEDRSRILNAGVAGALIGPIGAATTVTGQRRASRAQIDDAQIALDVEGIIEALEQSDHRNPYAEARALEQLDSAVAEGQQLNPEQQRLHAMLKKGLPDPNPQITEALDRVHYWSDQVAYRDDEINAARLRELGERAGQELTKEEEHEFSAIAFNKPEIFHQYTEEISQQARTETATETEAAVAPEAEVATETRAEAETEVESDEATGEVPGVEWIVPYRDAQGQDQEFTVQANSLPEAMAQAREQGIEPTGAIRSRDVAPETRTEAPAETETAEAQVEKSEIPQDEAREITTALESSFTGRDMTVPQDIYRQVPQRSNSQQGPLPYLHGRAKELAVKHGLSMEAMVESGLLEARRDGDNFVVRVPRAEAEAETARRPYQMTVDQFVEQRLPGERRTPEREQRARRAHRAAVLRAIDRGDEVAGTTGHPDIDQAVSVAREFDAPSSTIRPMAEIIEIVNRNAPEGAEPITVSTAGNQYFIDEYGQPRGALYHQNEIILNRDDAINSGDKVVATLAHEAAHALGEHLDSTIAEEWGRLTPMQRRAAAQEYGDWIADLSDAQLEDNWNARQEWFAFQFNRVLTGRVTPQQLVNEGFSQSFARRLKQLVDRFRKVIRDMIGAENLSTPELNRRILELIGDYRPGAQRAEAAQQAEVGTPTVDQIFTSTSRRQPSRGFVGDFHLSGRDEGVVYRVAPNELRIYQVDGRGNITGESMALTDADLRKTGSMQATSAERVNQFELSEQGAQKISTQQTETETAQPVTVEQIDGAINERARTNLFVQKGQYHLPGIRFQDAETAGRTAYVVEKGEASIADWNRYVESVRRENRLTDESSPVRPPDVAEGTETAAADQLPEIPEDVRRNLNISYVEPGRQVGEVGDLERLRSLDQLYPAEQRALAQAEELQARWQQDAATMGSEQRAAAEQYLQNEQVGWITERAQEAETLQSEVAADLTETGSTERGADHWRRRIAESSDQEIRSLIEWAEGPEGTSWVRRFIASEAKRELSSRQNLTEQMPPASENQAMTTGGVPLVERMNQAGHRATEEDVSVASTVVNKDVPQFKADADPATGVVAGEALEGEFDVIQAGRISVWEKLSGEREVISGRHRFNLAKTTGRETIPAYIFRESEGFGLEDAVILDAESNIKDRHGKVKDYAHYFKVAGISKAEAQARGLLQYDKGREGWSLGQEAVPGLFDLFANNQISQAKAVGIAQGAPNNEAAQMLAVKKAKQLNAEELRFYTQNLARLEGIDSQEAQQTGFESFFQDFATIEAEAEKEASAQAEMIKDVRNQIAAGKGAARNPEAARKLGIDVSNPEATKRQIAELEETVLRLQSPDEATRRQIRQRAGLEAQPAAEQQAVSVGREQVSQEVRTHDSGLSPDIARRLLSLPSEQQVYPMGPHNSELRQDVLEALTGTRPPKSKAGATAVQRALQERFGRSDSDIQDALKRISGQQEGPLASPREARYRRLQQKQRDGTITQQEVQELERLDRERGQQFLGLFDESPTATPDQLTAERRAEEQRREIQRRQNQRLQGDQIATQQDMFGQEGQMELFAPQTVARHTSLEAKHNAGTITEAERAEAKRIVDEAARAAGYDVGPVYHGTPTGGFTEFDGRYRGRSGGHARGGFSFTTNRRAAEAYANSFSDEDVSISAAMSVANEAMAKLASENQEAARHFEKQGAPEGIVEFSANAIDDAESFSSDLSSLAKEVERFSKGAANQLRNASKLALSFRGTPEVKAVYLKVGPSAKVIETSPAKMAEDLFHLDVRNEDTGSAIARLGENESIYFVADPSQIKSAEVFTGIPLDQRFNPESSSILFAPATETTFRPDGTVVNDADDSHDLLGMPRDETVEDEALFAPVRGSQEFEAIRNRVNTDLVDRRTIRERIRDSLNEKFDRGGQKFVQGAVDNLAALRFAREKVLGKGIDLDASVDPWKFAHLTREIRVMFEAWMMQGTYKYEDGDIKHVEGSKPLSQTLRELKDENGKSLIPMWETYVTAFRAERLLREGRERNFGFDREGYARALAEGQDVKPEDFWSEARARREIQQVKNEARQYPQLEKARQEYVEWQKALLDFAEAAGIVNPAARKQWENSDYVPFYRVSEAAEIAKEILGPQMMKDPRQAARVIRRLEGGTGRVAVLENIVKNFQVLMEESLKNASKQKIVRLLRGSGFIEKAKHRPVPVKSTKEELLTVLAAKRFDEMLEAGELPPQITSKTAYVKAVKEASAEGQLEMLGLYGPEDLDARINLWRMKKPEGQDVMTVMVDGKPQYWKVNDPMLMESVMALGPDAYTGLTQRILKYSGLAPAKRFLTEMITLEPGFIIANATRETVWSWAASQELLLPGVSAARGSLEMWRPSGELKASLRGAGLGSGANWGGYRNDPLMPANARKALEAMAQADRDSFMATVWDTPRKLFSGYRRLVETSEYMNRYGLAQSVQQAGGSNVEAAFRAKDLTNFTSHGGWQATRALIYILPFLNARAQGNYRLLRSRGGFNTKQARRQFLNIASKGMMLMAATVVLRLINRGNEEYEELAGWDKDAYYHLFPGGEHIRIPKPFEVGVAFSTIPERIISGSLGDDTPVEFRESVARMFFETFALNPLPQGIRQIAEDQLNRGFFTGMPVVGEWERLTELPEDQYSEFTSVFWRGVAERMPDSAPDFFKSPKRLEHFYRGMTGTLGAYVLDTANMMVRGVGDHPPTPERHWRDQPIMRNIVGRFWRSPDVRNSKYVSEFYEIYRDTERLIQRMERYHERGDVDAVDRISERHAVPLAEWANLTDTRGQLAQIRSERRQIHEDRDMSPAEKRERLQELRKRQNLLTQDAVRRTRGR